VSTYYFVGSGIASLAGAAYLIRDGNVVGKDVVIFEESKEYGGALDARGSPETGYFMSGSRMFESKYNCTFDLMSSIPSASDPAISITEETYQAERDVPWHNHARLVDRDAKIANFHSLGFSERDRLDLIGLMMTPERKLDSKRIDQWFTGAFFETNFWFEWCTLFAFQPWHSAIELRRYLRRFIQHFSAIDTQEGIFRTLYNQYDSIAAPLVKWLTEKGVRIEFDTTVFDLDFAEGPGITVNGIYSRKTGGDRVKVTLFLPGDCVFVTNGSMTADKAFGTMDSVAALDRGKRSGAWNLWETLAAGRPEFGNPAAFDAHVDESVWESFTVTVNDALFFDLMQKFSGSAPGRGGLITFKDSSWLITVSIFHQPYYEAQPPGVSVWWGYGLHYDKPGDYVKKPMAQCTGREILEEVLGHLPFADRKDEIIAASTVIPCVMPYITSQFLERKAGDRPAVVPAGSTNLAFIGQYCELPDDVVFTVEYSIRAAQMAVYSLLKLDKKPTPMYKGTEDPRVLLQALETMHR